MNNHSQTTPDLDELWQFAGQGLRASDFTSAMIHLYRGEVTRSNTWRKRLDNTTNWAVITTGAALTFTFGNPLNTHIVIILNAILALMFLLMEARRYRYYELWSHRIRLMETNFFAGLLSPPFVPSEEWANQISESLLRPRFPITLNEAFGRRYRRNYAPLFFILALGWIAKILIHPVPIFNLGVFLERAAIGPISGWIVILVGVFFHGTLMFVGIFSARLRHSKGEVFDQEINWIQRIILKLRHLTWEALEVDLHIPIPALKQRHEHLAYIISDNAEKIGQVVMDELKRGVTRMHGTGMYTGAKHSILMCVVDTSQTAALKTLVKQIDQNAFVIITAVKDVHGAGFKPLEA